MNMPAGIKLRDFREFTVGRVAAIRKCSHLVTAELSDAEREREFTWRGLQPLNNCRIAFDRAYYTRGPRERGDF